MFADISWAREEPFTPVRYFSHTSSLLLGHSLYFSLPLGLFVYLSDSLSHSLARALALTHPHPPTPTRPPSHRLSLHSVHSSLTHLLTPGGKDAGGQSSGGGGLGGDRERGGEVKKEGMEGRRDGYWCLRKEMRASVRVSDRKKVGRGWNWGTRERGKRG